MEGSKVKIKPVNTGKKEFQSREEAVIVAHLTIFRLSEGLNEGTEQVLSEKNSLPQGYTSRWRT